MGASLSKKLDWPRRPRLVGRPFPSSCIWSIGAFFLKACQAVRAPDFSICSAVMRKVPGAARVLPFWLTAGPQEARATRSDAVSAFTNASRAALDEHAG